MSGSAQVSSGGPHTRLRWVAMSVLWLSFTLNFLDRQLLAAVAPALKVEFHLSNTDYGKLVSAFYLVYALSAPAAGLFIDRAGLRVGVAIATTVWSLAGAATGVAQSYRGLLLCRMGLGLGESAGIPTVGKASATYLDPAELGLAGGFGAMSISLGSMAAPLIAAWLAPLYGWRSVFVLSGMLGMFWVPLWLFTSSRVPPRPAVTVEPRIATRQLLRDPRLWAVAMAYCLVYTLYMLWANWTTIYLVQERHLTQLEANARFAWYPPAFAILGGFLGGALTFRWIRNGMGALAARMRACWFTAPLALIGIAIPFLPSTAMAAVAIGISFLSFQGMLSNIAVMPIDLFGMRPAGFSNSLLAFFAAGTQVLVAPAIGMAADHFGFTAICAGVHALPLLGLVVLQATLRRWGTLATPAGPSPLPSR